MLRNPFFLLVLEKQHSLPLPPCRHWGLSALWHLTGTAMRSCLPGGTSRRTRAARCCAFWPTLAMSCRLILCFQWNASSQVAGQGAHQVTATEWVCNAVQLPRAPFSPCAHPQVLPDTVLLVPQNDFAVLPKPELSHSVALLQVCPCSFLHSKGRKWRQHDTFTTHSHCHHPTWSKAAKEKSLFQSFFRRLCSLVTVLTSC